MNTQQNRLKKRALLAGCVMLMLLQILTARLFQIQVIHGRGFSKRAASQRMLYLPLDFSRGQFYDTNMIPLTGRNKVDSLVVFPSLVEDREKAAAVIAESTDMEREEALEELVGNNAPFKLVLREDAATVKESGCRGIMVVKDIERYDCQSKAKHLIGYIDRSDRVGRSGLERLYESYLSAEGEMAVAAMVDGSKRLIPGLGYKLVEGGRSEQGYGLQLTIDYHVQKAVEEVADQFGIQGAVVVLDVESGEVLAMASRPDYEQGNVGKYLDGQRGELLNKAFQQYNLGSIFKTVVAAAALEDDRVNPFETIHCPGYTEVGSLRIKCSSYGEGGHGDLNIFEAYARSCNTYFIEMGQRVGGKRIEELARNFGLGSITGLNPLEEQAGLIPQGEKVHRSDLCNISIGQGDILVTPLQVAVMTNIIANNGINRKPYVVKGLIDDSGKRIAVEPPRKPEKVISPFVAMEIRKMMEMVVDSGTGTMAALPFFGGTAGKTSSAQTGQRIDDMEVLHAWFTGYVPKLYPKYVITVLVENGKSGGNVAAPIFRNIAQRIMELGDRPCE